MIEVSKHQFILYELDVHLLVLNKMDFLLWKQLVNYVLW